MKDYSHLNSRMFVNVIDEQGEHIAYYGMSLSYGLSSSFSNFIGMFDSEKTFTEKIIRVKDRIFNSDGGENKFLESIVVWMEIDAPRYWWQQFDTYRTGVTKNSESTMHTIQKRHLTQNDFVEDIDQDILDKINMKIDLKDFRWIKRHLPESFMQMRQITTNYKTIRNICKQRQHHRLHEWSMFVDAMLDQLSKPQYIGIEKNVNENQDTPK